MKLGVSLPKSLKGGPIKFGVTLPKSLKGGTIKMIEIEKLRLLYFAKWENIFCFMKKELSCFFIKKCNKVKKI